jgi:acetyl-CoA C-acetyltransferase
MRAGARDGWPVIVGVAQRTQRGVDPREAASPIGLMDACARIAAEECGGGRRLLAAVDRLAVVSPVGWRIQNAPRLLAQRLVARPAEEIATAIGGNLAQRLVNETARRIARGECRVALVAGAEAIYSRRRARRAGIDPGWETGGEGAPTMFGDERAGTNDLENAAGLVFPPVVYPIFENAIRARRGEGIEAHRARLGRMLEGFTAVAAQNPHAWIPKARSAAEITTVTPENRMIAFPYPKWMNAILDVDQAAALLMTSVAGARALGIPEEKWVHWWGGGDAIEDAWWVSERPRFDDSPAARRAGRDALDEAGVDAAEIEHLDLYSCFPSAVQLQAEALGIPQDGPRPLTVTGGLPYAGGPGNAYTLLSLASLVERLRASPGAVGLVTGIGWYMTRFSVGVFASAPPRETARAAGPAAPAPGERVALAQDATGSARIETYTVVHDKDGAPVRGIVVARTDDGRRVLANAAPERAVLESLETAEGVGRRGTVTGGGAVPRFEPAG